MRRDALRVKSDMWRMIFRLQGIESRTRKVSVIRI